MDRTGVELPPLRTRLADAWPFMGAFVGLLVGPFLVFPLQKVLFGWLIGTGIYLFFRALARRSLYDFISLKPEFGLDAQGRVHVLSNEREAFTPVKAWDAAQETRKDLWKVVMIVAVAALISAVTVIAAERWDEALAISAMAGGVIVMSIAEPLQQVRGRRRFKTGQGGIVLDPLVFGPLFASYVDSDSFDPADRTPHIDKVLAGAAEHLPVEQRIQMLIETKRRVLDRGHAGLAAGSVAKILRIFGG